MLNVDPAKLSTPQRLQLMRQMEGILKNDPKNPELWCNIGVLHAADERWDEAQKYYKKALSFRKNDPEILKRTVEAFHQTAESSSKPGNMHASCWMWRRETLIPI
ncbi:MAG: tetratricopeptide repeat protein [Phyllobacteriaceae bacterium]|nr:tetratricopeptide repeat protein [Phyllobacteriaceae bacterium]